MTRETKVTLVFLAGAPVEIGLILAVLMTGKSLWIGLLVVVVFALPAMMAHVKFKEKP